MGNHVNRVCCALAVVCLAHVANGQTAPPDAAAAPVSIVVANPTYTSIPLEITVNRPAAEVWKRVGKFCDIGEWLRIPCTIISGKDGEFGAVRAILPERGRILFGEPGDRSQLHDQDRSPSSADRNLQKHV